MNSIFIPALISVTVLLPMTAESTVIPEHPDIPAERQCLGNDTVGTAADAMDIQASDTTVVAVLRSK